MFSNKNGNLEEDCDRLLNRWVETMMFRDSPEKDSELEVSSGLSAISELTFKVGGGAYQGQG